MERPKRITLTTKEAYLLYYLVKVTALSYNDNPIEWTHTEPKLILNKDEIEIIKNISEKLIAL